MNNSKTQINNLIYFEKTANHRIDRLVQSHPIMPSENANRKNLNISGPIYGPALLLMLAACGGSSSTSKVDTVKITPKTGADGVTVYTISAPPVASAANAPVINDYTSIYNFVFTDSPAVTKIVINDQGEGKDILLQDSKTDPVKFYVKLVGAGTAPASQTPFDLYLKTGTKGNDTLTFDTGNGEKSHYFLGLAGLDTITGGTADDGLYGHAGNDTLHGGAGDDFLGGGAGDDILNGGAGDDNLFGGAGDDILNGGAGEDILFGGSGKDTLTGGEGDDTFLMIGTVSDKDLADVITDFSANTNKLLFQNSVSQIWFQKLGGKTYILDAAGGDTYAVLTGEIDLTSANVERTNENAITVTEYSNVADGSGVIYTISGSPVASVFDAPVFKDPTPIKNIVFSGGATIDKIVVNDLGDGEDVLLQDTNTITAKIYAIFENAGTGIPRTYDLYLKSGLISEPETLTFDTGNRGKSHYFLGGTGVDTITGGTKDDWLYGQDGDDILNGGAMNDTLFGGDGSDDLTGGDGADTFILQGTVPGRSSAEYHIDAADYIRDFGTGADKLFFEDNVSQIWFHKNQMDDITNILNGAGGDIYASLYGAVDLTSDKVMRNNGDAITVSEYGTDLLGNSVVYTISGTAVDAVNAPVINNFTTVNKIVFSGGVVGNKIWVKYLDDGENVLLQDAETGNAKIYAKLDDAGTGIARTYALNLKSGLISEPETLTFDTGKGSEAYYILGGDGIDTITGGTADDWLHGEAGDDILNGAGGDDGLSGGADNDTLNGGAGADRLDGGAGDDILTGGDGEDTLFGGYGADTLTGGDGEDTLFGGGGADKFVLDKTAVATDTDIIKDFSKVETDKIQIVTTDGNEDNLADLGLAVEDNADNNDHADITNLGTGADKIIYFTLENIDHQDIIADFAGYFDVI